MACDEATNRAILLTPPGVAAIAVVRLVGPQTRRFLASYFSAPLDFGELGRAASSRPIHGTLRDETGAAIDDPVIVLSPGKRFADVNLHGGAWVVRAVLELAQRNGFDICERPTVPLPDDAIDSTDTIDREIEAYLPLATTELALHTLLAQNQAWQMIESRSRDELAKILEDRSLHWLLNPPRVAIAGAANVGKSTLANQLFAQERSITADVPGTTRDWVGEMANLDGLAVRLVDTPGIRETRDSIEREAISRSQAQIERADLIVLLLDASRPLSPEQSPLMTRFPDAMTAINKIDANHAWDVSTIDAIHTVATTGRGVNELMQSIRAHFGCDPIDPTSPKCWTIRQREWLRQRINAA